MNWEMVIENQVSDSRKTIPVLWVPGWGVTSTYRLRKIEVTDLSLVTTKPQG